jgi:hypothetical protein
MKNILLVVVFLGISHLLSAQRNGVYLTYDDYVNHKVIEADKKTMHYPHGKNGKVSLEANGAEKSWDLSEIWGVRIEGNDYRATHGAPDGLIRIILKGIYIYYYAEKDNVYNTSDAYMRDTDYKTRYYLSKTLTSPIYLITLKDRPLDAFIKAHTDEFKELADYRKKYPDMKPYKVVQGCINDAAATDVK